MFFRNRSDAGQQLGRALESYRGKDVVVLALPRGGVPVAAEVARHLDAPLDLLLVRKLGVPAHPELAMGAVVDDRQPIAVRNEGTIRFAQVSPAEFSRAYHKALREIERRRSRYLGGRPPERVAGRIAIVVDDGVATGATVRAAIKGLRHRNPAAIVLAVPAAPPSVVTALKEIADRVVCLEQPPFFRSLSFYYDDFTQVSDEEVVERLRSVPSRQKALDSVA